MASVLVLIGIMIGRSTVPGRNIPDLIEDWNLHPDRSVWRVYDLDEVFKEFTGQSIASLESSLPAGSGRSANICFPSDERHSSLQLFQQALIDAIEQTIEPDSWYTNGGNLGTVRPFGRRLAVWQIPRGQERVREFFSALRQDPQKTLAAAPGPESKIGGSGLADDAGVWRVYDVGDIVETCTDQLIADWKSGPIPGNIGYLDTRLGEGRYRALEYVHDKLVRCIRETVDPGTWREFADSTGEIAGFGHKIMVWNTARTHAKIGSMLDELRRDPRKLQNHISVRKL